MEPRFFASGEEFGAWLEENHDSQAELLVGFHKTGSGRPSMTWPESVEQALRFGWIDGVRRRIDDESYTIRFTPRKPTSHWSAVNVAKVDQLGERGLMHPAGIAAFERRREDRTAIYAYEQDAEPRLSEEFERRLEAVPRAAEFLASQAPWYRRNAIHWVMRAKREDTRERRIASLIECCAEGRTLPHLTRR